MKKLKSIIALLLTVLMLAAVLSACGDSDKEETTNDNTTTQEQNDTGNQAADPTDPTEPVEITGELVMQGDYVVLVPEGYSMTLPGEFSPFDFAVKKSDFYYFDFNTEADDDNMMQHYNYNKATYTNEQVDVRATYGENDWIGFQYSDGFGGYGFEAYTTISDKIVRVSSAGYTFDSPEAQAVLASLARAN